MAQTKTRPSRVQPDTRVYELSSGDVVMLCSDGLSSMCLDNEIADIIEQFRDNPQVCRDELISGALSHGGHDNVTVALCSVQFDESEELATTLRNEAVGRSYGYRNIFLLLLVIMILVEVGFYFFLSIMKC